MFIYNNLWSKIKTFKSIPKLFVEKFIELFYRTYYSEDVKELLLNKTIIEECLPSINDINTIIEKEYLFEKEVWFVKVIIDMMISYHLQNGNVEMIKKAATVILKLINKMKKVEIRIMNSDLKAVITKNQVISILFI